MISPLYLKLKIILLYIYIFNMDFQKEFFDASQNGHYNVVKLLLEDKRVNPVDENNLAIQWASEYGHYNIIKLLLGDNRVINSFNIDNINYIKHYSSKKIINFYKKYFNLYRNIDIFLLININLW